MAGTSTCLLLSASVDDEAVAAVIGTLRHFGAAAIDAIEPSEQDGGWVVGVGESVIRPRDLAGGCRAYRVGRDQDHQLGLAGLIIAAAEQRAQDRDVLKTGNAIDALPGLLLKKTAEHQ